MAAWKLEAKIKPKRTRASAKGVTPKTIPLDKNQTDLKEAKILTPKKRVPKKAKKLEEEIVTENASVGTIEKNDTQAVPPKPKKRGWWSKS